MKKFKRIYSGFIAAAMVLGCVHTAMAQAPLTVIDEADATGISETELDTGGALRPAQDGQGSWSLITGGSGGAIVGNIMVDENDPAVLNIARTTTTRERQLSAKYITNVKYSSTDQRVQFSAETDANAKTKAQLLQVSSNTADSELQADGERWMPTGSTVFKNGAVLRISEGALEYLNGGVWETADINIAPKTKYFFQIERVDDETFNLYADTKKIGVNTKPIAENVKLMYPDGMPFSQVSCYLGKQSSDAEKYSLSLGNIRFIDGVPTKAGSVKLFGDSFDRADLGSDWKQYSAGSIGAVKTSDNELFVFHNSGSKFREIYASKTIDEIAGQDKLEVSYDFVSDLSASYIRNFIIASKFADEDIIKPNTFDGKEVTQFCDSVHLLVYNNQFWYGDETTQSFTPIDVAYSDNARYYVKTVIDNVNQTFDLYLSDSPIGAEAAPVVSDASLFHKTGNSVTGITMRLRKYDAGAQASIRLDNLTISKPVQSQRELVDFAVFNDEQQIAEELGNSRYIDIVNVPENSIVIAAGYDESGKLVDVKCGADSSFRYEKNDESVTIVKVMLWDSLENVQPVRDVMVLN